MSDEPMDWESDEPKQHLYLSISGTVQGVGYRLWFQSKAKSLGISGWVKNCDDGRVEALVSGPFDKVEALLVAALVGPSFAKVDSLRRVGEAPEHTGAFEVH
ncbi:acylphosphatase [Flexibacterium corallicola]|uniref:acylphosphatase n=1 Tax=Flexibacterium corallicola TaxID=3037259 RepID=UPI00286F02D3|nr:acylphosphatase [Pseudovibrio sp. M1P-2-3]